MQKTVVTQVKEMMESAFASQQWGNKLLTAQGVDSRMLSDVAPIDDEVPPFQPTGVTGTPFLGAVSVSWNTPNRYDYVNRANVEYTAQEGETEGVVNEITVTTQTGTVIYDLDYVDYVFRVQFVDVWDRVSAWSDPVTARPHETANYKIDLEKARQLGNIASILSVINASLIAGENFAEGTVKQISLATPEHPNQLPMIEVDFDQWEPERVWPPTDSDINGVQYIQAQIP
jgi:hypothetical protein